MTFRLVPEVLDSVDVIGVVGEQFGVVDPNVMELRDIQHVISAEAVGIDDRIRPHFVSNDREKRIRAGIWDDHDMHLAAPLQEPEDGNLARRAASSLALAYRPPK